jgi:secondary thiamine-phosphate synthase enzyme
MIYQDFFEVETKAGISLRDITRGVVGSVKESGVRNGICNVFLTSTTAGLLINENEIMLLEDIKKFYRPFADDNRVYQHPSNAASHLRANLLAKDISIPVKDGNPVLGEWQNILLAEFDKVARKRKIFITIIGE